ncbi:MULTISPECIES: helix-turn-helix domain-containing protein [Brevibacillus]|uniref:helix-turn-helix domain-containing protein n=1 Tax=Brevibacillus TaxID=55080 RepID=UPI0002715505|nr:AraC family transcriptional regulator [Brevibacillus sp. CF112]EJL45730.1 response regulator containing CheY-like receiver domain and AraC-type DNA-binding domain [Brevibacillus sp. CF112]
MERAKVGLLIDYYARGAITLTSVSLEERQPGMKYFGGRTGLHSAFIFPLSGRAKMWFDGTGYDMEPGMVVHAGPDMAFDRKVIGEEKWVYILVLYQVKHWELADACDYAGQHYGLHLVEQSARLQEKLRQLERYWNSPGDLYKLRVKELWYGILNELFSLVLYRAQDEGRLLLERLLDYIHNQYMENLSMNRLAEMHQINVNRLAYLFQKHLKISPGEYLNRYRLNQAKNLLNIVHSQLSIKEVAQRTGFSDPLYFSKRFKKYTGLSPSEFQRDS